MKNTWIERNRQRKLHEESEASWNRYQSELDKIFSARPNNHPSDRAKKIAVLLENQRIWNSKQPTKAVDLDFLSKVYGSFVGFDLVPVNPMLGPSSFLHYEEKGVMKNEDISARTRMINHWQSNEIANEMSREIIHDLRRNVGYTMEVNSSYLSQIDVLISRMSLLIFGSCGISPSWCVMGLEMARHLFPDRDFSSSSIELLPEHWFEKKVIVDPLFPKNEILMGSYDELLKGYSYNPYVPLTPIENPYISSPSHRYFTRYSKKLLSPDPYGLIKIGDFEKQHIGCF